MKVNIPLFTEGTVAGKDTITLQQKSDEIIQQVNKNASIVASLAVDNYKKATRERQLFLVVHVQLWE